MIDLVQGGDCEPRSSDRYGFLPKPWICRFDSGIFQIGVPTLRQQPCPTVNVERHSHTQDLRGALSNPIVAVFSKNKGPDPQEESWLLRDGLFDP